jgi:hypothetical protein
MNNLGVALAGGGGKRRKDDFYPTPAEATIALLDEVSLPECVWEPACGDGAMCNVLLSRGHIVAASDLVNRGYGLGGKDFLLERSGPAKKFATVTNPPFKLAEEFIRHALKFTPIVCMLLKATFPNAAKRIALFEEHPPSRILPLGWRLDFTNQGAPTMDCTWFCWGVDGSPFKVLRKPDTMGWLQ